MKQVIQTSRAFVAFVEDGQGRRLVIGERKGAVMESTIVVTLDKEEAREMSNALRSFIGDLSERAS